MPKSAHLPAKAAYLTGWRLAEITRINELQSLTEMQQ
jgi:hypothetical protein